MRAEVLVWNEDYLAVRRECRHHALGVARRYADVALGLHFGGGVHVADRRGGRVPCLQLAQLGGRHHVGHRAARRRVGDEDGLARVQYRRGLGHEVHAAEHYDVGVSVCGASRKLKGVAGEVGNLLNLGPAVVVRQDYGIALALEPGNLFDRGQAFFAISTTALNPAGSLIAISLSILRLRATPAFARPAMSFE